MQKTAWALVGLLVGVLIATAVPAGAHHRSGQTRLERRIFELEDHVRRLTDAHNEVVDEVDRHSSTLSDFSTRIINLERKTWNMDSSGNYLGKVKSWNVEIPSSCHGQTAAWTYSTGLFC
jgi:uncharacterized protein YlxW (UPF0749 family)